MDSNSIPENIAGGILKIDLNAIQRNYQILMNQLNGVPLAAVVKADGYGLGAEQICRVLWHVGCDVFFVAHINEGITLRSVLPDAEIHILNGLFPDALEVYHEHLLIPVLGSLSDLNTWKTFCYKKPLPCDIHVDTGMLRLGLTPAELSVLQGQPNILDGLKVRFIMSHLASADDVKSELNSAQLDAFKRARTTLPMGQACFANSSGIFLGPEYHFDIARPGVALYGLNPTPSEINPMEPVVTLIGRILQIRDAQPGETVGYNATHNVRNRSKIATVSVGYADGYLRSLSNKASGMIDGNSVPLVGRVSMDLITFDVTAVPEPRRQPGQFIELIGKNNPIDEIAQSAGTIGYEILTNLGRRYNRIYIGGPK